jgi:hypothetical protein
MAPDCSPTNCFRNATHDHRRLQVPLPKSPVPRSRTCCEGPFGELLRATGPTARINPIRFSTKYQDDETDLLFSRVSVKALFALWLGGPVVLWSVFL